MSTVASERSRSMIASRTGPSILHLVRGGASVLAMQAALMELACRSGQACAMDDLEYLLSRPQIRKKTPCLVSRSSSKQSPAEGPSSIGLDAAVLLYEHQIGGHGIRIFA